MHLRSTTGPALFLALAAVVTCSAQVRRQRENLGRGLIALRATEDRVFLSWRLLASDPPVIAFHVYRTTGDDTTRLNGEPVVEATCFIDQAFDASETNTYFVEPVLNRVAQTPSKRFKLPANSPVRPYLSVPLRTPEGCTPNDASVGDLDGDGEYEIVIKQEMRGIDNSHGGFSGQTKLEAYTLDGTLLWRIDLGRNIREGAHYTPWIVYDLDGDGRAEVACKTADGTVDGTGRTIGDPDADYRNRQGYVLDGPEFLTIFAGQTGAELVTTNYIPPRGKVADWGDDYGNRVDRFLACVAYLDGQRPSLVMCRGYYTRTVLAAWNWRDGQLTQVWTFDSDDGTPGNARYRGQGNHSLSVGDVDDDGRDEIVYGACCIDDDGSGLYSTGLGHGDALHLSDFDPDRPGLEVFGIHERPEHPHGMNLREAATGQVIWSAPSPDVSRGLALDIDPRYRGSECWAAGRGLDALYDCRGTVIPTAKPRSCNMGVWWDGDPLRELLDGTRIDKWDYQQGTTERLVSADRLECASNNGTKANPCLCADILGDWREEVIWRTRDNRELRIFSTTIATQHRLPTLMHDPIYRLSVVWQNVGYNQPAHPGFFLADAVSQRTDKAASDRGPIAPKPLYRDPVYDGAADPVLIWNRQRKRWWMLYTNRRANVPGLRGVSWVHGTRIGWRGRFALGAGGVVS
jgi:rhamnogalacturonan endolyase